MKILKYIKDYLKKEWEEGSSVVTNPFAFAEEINTHKDIYFVCNLSDLSDLNWDEFNYSEDFYSYNFNPFKKFNNAGYYLDIVVGLNTINPFHFKKYALLRFVCHPIKWVKIVSYHKRVIAVAPKKIEYDNFDDIQYDDTFSDYINQMEKWILEGKKPREEENLYLIYHFNEKEFDYSSIPLYLYSKDAVDQRNRIMDGDHICLGDIFDFVHPGELSKESHYFLKPTVIHPNGIINDETFKELDIENNQIPFFIENRSQKMGVQLHKNDICIFIGGPHSWLYFETEPPLPLFFQGRVLRIKDPRFSIEYIKLFFSSPVGEIALAMCSGFDDAINIEEDRIPLIPILLPKEPLSFYEIVFDEVFNTDLSLEKYKFSSIQRQYFWDEQDVFPQQLLQMMKSRHDKSLHKLIMEDWIEMEKCYSVGAYKAVTIFGGAILEAVLMDWVSEIDGVNYFVQHGYDKRQRAYVYGENRTPFKNKDGGMKKIDLKGLIDRIDNLKPPAWLNSEKEYAESIRNTRNQIHIGKAISEEHINKERCQEMIEYLKIVIGTRGIIIDI